MLIDTHAHLDDEKYSHDQEEVINNAMESGINTIINVGFNEKTIKSTLKLVEKYDFIYGAIGWHPNHSHEMRDEDYEWLKDLTSNPKIVAIGEIGLDYYWDYSPKETQKEVFIKQLKLANEVNLPIIIHDREAHQDILNIIKQEKLDGIKGVMHSFSGSVDMAMECIKMGFYISFSGPVTFKNAKKSLEVVKSIPLDRILIETDSPYLTPEPYRGKRNEPAYVQYIAKKIAEIRDLKEEEIILITGRNAKEVFNL